MQDLTWEPRLIVEPNQIGLPPAASDEVHHVLRGMLDEFAEMQVSPVSILQYTIIASPTLPWLGSTQYSPVTDKQIQGNIHGKQISTYKFHPFVLTQTHHSSLVGSIVLNPHKFLQDAFYCHQDCACFLFGC